MPITVTACKGRVPFVNYDKDYYYMRRLKRQLASKNTTATLHKKIRMLLRSAIRVREKALGKSKMQSRITP